MEAGEAAKHLAVKKATAMKNHVLLDLIALRSHLISWPLTPEMGVTLRMDTGTPGHYRSSFGADKEHRLL